MPYRNPWLVGALAVAALTGAAAIAPATFLPASTQVETIDTSRLRPAFTDNFDGNRLDPAKWSEAASDQPVTSRTLAGNAERQVYFDPRYLGLGIQPLSVSKGVLTITARPLTGSQRSAVAAAVATLPPDQRHPPLSQLSYSSGRITTLGRFSQKYGYFEIRARFDPGRGLWPAFWLLPANGGWPPEIDVMEALGHDPDTVYATVHSSAAPRQTVTSRLATADGGWHRYGVRWGPQTIDVFVDGEKTGSAQTPRDAHQPMYMIVNLAVGGNWPGYPDAQTKFPATMEVDYVRAWTLR